VARWFAVRCIFRIGGLAAIERTVQGVLYEERVTLWQAGSAEDAIELAEAQCDELSDPPAHGAEVFSLMRESELDETAYLDTFFDAGTERQGEVAADDDE